MTKECYIHGEGNDTFSTGLNSFVLVDVESLSLEDIFMQHEPVTQTQENLKSLITEAIEKKEKNFYKSVYDPSLKVIETEKEITFGPAFLIQYKTDEKWTTVSSPLFSSTYPYDKEQQPGIIWWGL